MLRWIIHYRLWIMVPKDEERVLKTFTILALLEDRHLDSSRLDYSTTKDSTTGDWEQIYMETGLYPLQDEAKSGAVKINEEWEVPIKDGKDWIRLLATDIADNTKSQDIQVEIPTAVITRKDGTNSPDD